MDGKWTPAADGKGEPTYAPRSAEEIAQIKSLVAAAAGAPASRWPLPQPARIVMASSGPTHLRILILSPCAVVAVA